MLIHVPGIPYGITLLFVIDRMDISAESRILGIFVWVCDRAAVEVGIWATAGNLRIAWNK